jgi:phosphocarrier protein
MIKEQVVVMAKAGLHARPANNLVKKAQTFKCTVEIGVNGKKYNAKSMLGILASGVNYGTTVEVICTGEDEEEACKQIIHLIKEDIDKN